MSDTDDDDPFDPRFDPYAIVEAEPIPRRALLRVLAATPAALATTTACVGRRLACVVPGEVREGACAHRFCRHYRG
jgi:hypothetical protein